MVTVSAQFATETTKGGKKETWRTDCLGRSSQGGFSVLQSEVQI